MPPQTTEKTQLLIGIKVSRAKKYHPSTRTNNNKKDKEGMRSPTPTIETCIAEAKSITASISTFSTFYFLCSCLTLYWLFLFVFAANNFKILSQNAASLSVFETCQKTKTETLRT